MQAFPYHWHHYEEYGATKLRIFCLSGKNESIYIEIDDFLPYIYVELPIDKTWSPASLSVVQTKLKEMSFNSIVKMEFVSKKKLYFAKKDKTETGEYVDKTYPFLKCFFKTTTNIRTFSYKLRQPIFFSGSKITLKIHEADANPVLQFMCMMDIKPASWFAFKGKKRATEDERESVCDHEFLCSYRHFAPIDNKGKVPARPYILSFDIEVNSHNPNVFPQSSQPEDKVFQISCVFARNGDPEDKFEKYILTLCKNKKGEIVDLNMDKLGDGIEVLGYETEGQLLEGFKDLVLEKNPQIICGYNIFSFDILYLYERSKMCNIERQFTQFSCMRGVPCKMKEISWSSSAFKNQEFKYLDAHGRLWIDLLPIIQRDYKLENYKLKTVSDQFLAASKDPLTPKGIFKCYRMFTPDSLALVGKYCVQDSNLVLKLFEKLQIWIGLCEMSNTCNTPMFTLFTQGQQIKIFSQVYKKCMADNIVIDKDSFVTNESDRFTGAYVFPPVPGLYEMVVSFDFSSLYPSTIISNNIDYSTLVLDPSIPDEKCHVIEWEEHINCACAGAEIKTTKKEVVCDKQRHRFMKEPMGVLPTLLKNLLDARKRTNAEMKQMTIELEEMTDKASAAYDDKKRMITVLDKRQLSYKVSANSVAPNTPIPCIDADGTFMYLTMEEISDTLWVSDDDLNEVSKPRKGLSVWTEKGFTPIKYVIRHPIRTPLKRVLTHTGCVDVTEEHSLLDENAKKVRTIDVSIGDKLLHATLPLPSDTPKTPAPIALATKNEKAFLWGSFFATETVSEDTHLFYDVRGSIRIPSSIFSADLHTRQSFFMGYFANTKNATDLVFMVKGEIGSAGLCYLLKTLGYSVCIQLMEDNVYRLDCSATPATISVKSIVNSPVLNATEYIYDIETENHHFAAGVGDLIVHNSMYGGMGTRKGYLPFLYGATCTTAKGRQSIEKASKFLVENYGAKLIYGDTDSCYINFSEYADKTKAKDLDSFCRQVESEISSLFPKPMKFAYEEQIYWRYLILTKKRYMALKCDLDGNVDNKIAKRGVLLSRRDNSKYIRDTYANTILKSFYREDLDVVLMKLFEDVKKLCVNALPVKDLVVTKGIGAIADYKIRPLHVDDKKCKKRLQELGLYHEEANMDVLRNIITAFGRKEDVEDESYLHNLEYLIFKEYVKLSLPAQIQLAERMRARGSHVSAGERLGYVITQNGDKLGEKMEDTDYFKEHAESLKIDYLYYMKLMINPFDEVLETVYGEKDLFKKFYKTREQFKKVMDQLHKLFMPRLRFVE